ncbi:DNA/RNA non-specific endonuclease [Microbacteriaceae bacterium VKM Ac-2854]|nr:DNA/RNA non-specific endonuclease [Microbacteriaceae bacterium VKM Ac-2854]
MSESGFSTSFLAAPVVPPTPPVSRAVRRLDYTHFTVWLDPERRLALSTGVNIDGSALLDLGRGDDWHLDARIPESEQTGPAVYARNDLDRGHLVRRRDPVWGERAIAQAANVDSFCYTNAAPQASGFNQSKELWLGVETLVFDFADVHDAKLSVFTGPVLAADDPIYRGVGIPRHFWKIAVWSPDGASLASSAYVLDQSALIEPFERDEGVLPDLGAFRTFQVAVAEVGALTGLDVAALADVDRFAPGVTARGESPWRELAGPEDVLRGIRGD